MNLDPVEAIKEAIGNIRCYSLKTDELESVGTGFLIKNNLIITAFHTLESYIKDMDSFRVEATFKYNDEPEHRINRKKFKTLYEDEKLDILILQIDLIINEIEVLEFAEFEEITYSAIHNIMWKTFGFPIKHGSENLRAFDGHIVDCLSGEKYDLSLNWDGIEQISSEGLSGAPILIDNKVLGIILQEINPTTGSKVGILSTNKIVEILNGIDLSVSTLREENIIFKDINLRQLEMKIEQNKLFEDELSKIYMDQLEIIRDMRLSGYFDDAWTELISKISQIEIPSIKGAYNKTAATWEYYDSRNIDSIDVFLQEVDKNVPTIDKRSINTRIAMLRGGRIDEVTKSLKPYNSEEVVICALQLSLEYQRPKDVENILSTMKIGSTHQIEYWAALCYLAYKNFFEAQIHIKLALKDKECPAYIYAEGLINYWKSIPKDIVNQYEINPVMFERGLFIPTQEQTDYLEYAITCFKDVKAIARKCNNKSLMEKACESIFMTCDLIQDKQAEAYEEALNTLECNNLNGMALIFIARYYSEKNNINLEYLNQYTSYELFDVNCVVALILYLISHDKIEESIKVIEENKLKFVESKAESIWAHYNIYLSILNKDMEKANLLLSEDIILSSKEKSRLRCLSLEITNDDEKIIEIIKENISLYSDRMNYKALLRIYYNNKDFKSSITLGTKFLNKYKDAEVIELMAQSYLELGEYINCIKILEDNKSCFPYGKFNNKINNMRIDANWSRGDTIKALSIAQEAWEYEKSPRLLFNISRLLFVEGKTIDAIIFLKIGLNESVESAEAYMFLAQLLAEQKDRDALLFVEKALDKYGNDSKVILSAIHFGFRFGYDTKANQLLEKYQKEFQDDGLLKQISIRELMSTLENKKNQNETLSNLYREGQIPIHTFFEFINSSLAYYFFSAWDYNNSQMEYYSKIPLMISYGDKKSSVIDLKGKKVVMDYTACITAKLLNLFDIIEDYFEQIIIPHSLFEIITGEIYKIRDAQKSVIDNNEKLLEILKNSSITYIPKVVIEKSKTELEVDDIELWEAAKIHQAYIVEEIFATELMEKASIPKDLNDLRVYSNEVLQALLEVNEIDESTIKRFYRTGLVRKDSVDFLKEKSLRLIVNKVFLTEMMQLGCLDIIADRFELLFFEDELKSLKAELKAYSQQLKYSKQLTDLRDKLVDIKNRKKVVLTPIVDKKEYMGELPNLLYEELKFAEQENCIVWIDDRNIISYDKIGESPLINTFDILENMREKLGQGTYELKMHELLKRKCFFYIPSLDYCWSIIKEIQVDEKLVELKVNKKLSAIKNSILSSIVALININNTKITSKKLPEIVDYTWNLQNFFQEILAKVWSETSKTLVWRNKISDWLILNFYGYIFTVESFDYKEINNITIGIQARMLFPVLNSSSGDLNEAYRDYYNFVFRYFEANWDSYPQNKIKVTDMFISHFIQSNENNHFLSGLTVYKNLYEINGYNERKLFEEAFFLWIRRMPEIYQQIIYDKIKGYSSFHPYIKDMVNVEGFPGGIELRKWAELCGLSFSTKNQLPVQSEINKIKVEISHIGILLYEQALVIVWVDENESRRQVNILEPCIQLYSDEIDIRLQWLELAKVYFDEEFDFEKYNQKLSEEIIDEFTIKELQKELDSSANFFFDKLKYLIKSKSQLRMTDMLPEDVNIFLKMNIPEFPLKESFYEWREELKCISTTEKVIDFLDIYASLPFGQGYSLTDVTGYLIEVGMIDYHEVISWSIKKVDNIMDFTTIHNVVSVLLSNYKKLEQENKEVVQQIIILLFEKLDECIVNESTAWNTYILLVKLGWRLIGNNDIYTGFSEHNKIIWSYIFASKVITILNEINNETKLDFKKINIKISEFIIDESIKRSKTMFSTKISNEVTNPENASMFKIIFGGIINLVDTYKEDVNVISSLIDSKLASYSKKMLENEFNIEGTYEQYYIFDNMKNEFNNFYNVNQREKLENILICGDEKNEVKFQVYKLAENLIRDVYDSKKLIDYIYFFFKNGITESAYEFVKASFDNIDFNYKNIDNLNKLALLISMFPNENKKKEYIEKLLRECGKMIEDDKANFISAVEILVYLSLGDNFDYFCLTFIDLLETLVYNLEYKFITKEIIDYINSIMWWITTENYYRINKLRLYVITGLKIENKNAIMI